MASRPYFRVTEEIWEIDYVIFKVPLLKCKRIRNNIGVQINELGLTRVDLRNETYMNKSFIMASQAKQVFYVTGLSDRRW